LSYQRLDAESSLTRALLEPRYAHRAPAPTDLRWVPALAALLLLLWRFVPRWVFGSFARP